MVKLRVAFGTLFLAERMLRVACFCLDVSVLSALKLATSLPTMFTWHQGCVGKNGLKTSIFYPAERASWIQCSIPPGQDCQNWEFLHAEQGSNHATSVFSGKVCCHAGLCLGRLSFFPLYRSFLMSISTPWNVQTECNQPRKRSMDLPHRRRQMQVKKAGAFQRLGLHVVVLQDLKWKHCLFQRRRHFFRSCTLSLRYWISGWSIHPVETIFHRSLAATSVSPDSF